VNLNAATIPPETILLWRYTGICANINQLQTQRAALLVDGIIDIGLLALINDLELELEMIEEEIIVMLSRKLPLI